MGQLEIEVKYILPGGAEEADRLAVRMAGLAGREPSRSGGHF